ncbi:MAG: tetratricopeptide repeat protein [Kiritimatiellae bacterium]|nr:tetratricopeptide repeat protein [Kiritimatiellia bacterium]MDW8457619.1 tetratricopeptide repeat protein [Verrucomicrobiota bacterium]
MIRRTPLILCVLALIAFSFHILTRPVPGFSSSALAGYAGLDPFRLLSTPLWGALIQASTVLTFLPISLAAVALQVLCAAVSVYLLARILMDLPYRELLEDSSRGMKDDSAARAVAAVLAALFLCASSSAQAFYLMPQPDALALPLLLAAWWAFQRYYLHNQLGALYLCAALLSVGAIESATIAIAAPLFAAFAFVVLAVRRQLNVRTVTASVACSLAGVFVLLAALALYYWSDVAAWREVKSFQDVFTLFRAEYMAAGPRAIPRQGWLVIFLLALLPLPAVFSRGIQVKSDQASEIGLSLLRFAVLPGLALVILFELPGAPNRVAQTEMALLTPYAAAALWFGRLMGIAFIWLGYPQRRRSLGSPPAQIRPVALAPVVLAVAAILYAGWQNAPRSVRANAVAFAALTDRVLESATEGGWIVSDGAFDDAIRIAARDGRRDVRLLNAGALTSPAYLRFLQARHDFADPEWVLAVGADTMLRDWISREESAGRPPVLLTIYPPPLNSPSRIRREGLYARIVREPGPDADELKRALEGIQRDTDLPPLKGPLSMGLARIRAWTVSAGARWSNEIGVDLFAAGETNAAKEAFEWALSLQPDHLAARINLTELRRLAGESVPEEDIEAIRRGMAGYPQGAMMVAIRSQYGRTILKEAAALESAEWAALGYPGRALELAREQATVADSPAARLSETLRAAAMGDVEGVREELEKQLAENPQSLPHLRALLRIQTREGRFAEASHTLERFKASGAATNDVALEAARLMLAQQKWEEAARSAEEVLKRDPLNPEAALLRALALASGRRLEEWRAAMAVLEQASSVYVPGLLYLAESAMNNRDRAAALRYLERAHAVQPGARLPLELLLSVELPVREPEDIEARARSLLAIDPENPLGWYAIAIAMTKRSRWLLAADAFARAAERGKAPQIFNDWAWTLRELGRLEEALEKTEQACRIAPQEPILWATRGRIAADLGRHDLAIESFERTRSLAPRVANELLEALEQSYLAVGNSNAAARVRAELDERQAFLTSREVRAAEEKPSAPAP